MSRKLLLLLLLFNVITSFSQEYYLSIRNLEYRSGRNDCNFSSGITIYAIDDNDVSKLIINTSINEGRDGIFISNINEGFNKRIKEIRVYAYDNIYGSGSQSCSYESGYENYNSIVNLTGYCSGGRKSGREIKFNYSFRPNIDIVYPTGDTTRAVDDPINAEVSAGYDGTSLYNWEYQVGRLSQDDREWITIPNANGHILSQAPKDFLPNVNNYIGRNIFIRLKACDSYYTRINTYTIIAGSPNLVGDIVAYETTCNYSEDGKFTFTVDRDLVRDEKLVISLYMEDSNNPEGYSFLTQETTETLIDNRDQTYSYTWQGGLAPLINYQIKFQTLIGSGEIPGTDSSWASLEFSDPNNPFRILPAENIVFKAQRLNNETCFELGDGKINLHIESGEQGRTYSYKIFKVNTDNTTTEVTSNWVIFNGMSTVIENLEKNTYRVKVKDNQGCFARQI
jgi:hypothetical protein